MRISDWSSDVCSSDLVSMMVKRRSTSLASPGRRSRVTPGVSSTSASFLPTSLLNSVDLPTFGRPTIATVKLMRLFLQPFPLRDLGRLAGCGDIVEHDLRAAGDIARRHRVIGDSLDRKSTRLNSSH